MAKSFHHLHHLIIIAAALLLLSACEKTPEVGDGSTQHKPIYVTLENNCDRIARFTIFNTNVTMWQFEENVKPHTQGGPWGLEATGMNTSREQLVSADVTIELHGSLTTGQLDSTDIWTPVYGEHLDFNPAVQHIFVVNADYTVDHMLTRPPINPDNPEPVY